MLLKCSLETIAIGWGRTDPNPRVINSNAPQLKKVSLTLLESDLCEGLASMQMQIDKSSQQCVQVGRDSVCQGDSGGPLLCEDGGVNYVCGISSFVGSTSCVNGFDVFVRVYHYRKWIKEVMTTGRQGIELGIVKPKFIYTPPPGSENNEKSPGTGEVLRTTPTMESDKNSTATSISNTLQGLILIPLLFVH